MTRSQIVSADTVKLAEFEDQLRELQNNFCRNFDERIEGRHEDLYQGRFNCEHRQSQEFCS